MYRITRTVALAAVLLSSASLGKAQDIQWKQTINLPKGLNMPQGVSADILGIQLGDTYEEAKTKAMAYLNEVQVPGSNKSFAEQRRVFQLPLAGGNTIQMGYVGGIRMELHRRGTPIVAQGDESITLVFSAPSSGHQVIGIKRVLYWDLQQYQGRVSEFITALEAKFKSRAWKNIDGGRVTLARFQFNNGHALTPSNATVISCIPHVLYSLNQDKLKGFNPDGACDVVLEVTFNRGISNDHTAQITFSLSDNERGKQNLTADYAFFSDYIQGLRQRTGGAPAKL
ncbi:MAG: hypothetical protein GC182_20725 [Rhodopseudomonas sp.]|nr:hypothetical protein [Rhodopseudomonas sp.]